MCWKFSSFRMERSSRRIHRGMSPHQSPFNSTDQLENSRNVFRTIIVYCSDVLALSFLVIGLNRETVPARYSFGKVLWILVSSFGSWTFRLVSDVKLSSTSIRFYKLLDESGDIKVMFISMFRSAFSGWRISIDRTIDLFIFVRFPVIAMNKHWGTLHYCEEIISRVLLFAQSMDRQRMNPLQLSSGKLNSFGETYEGKFNVTRIYKGIGST